MNKYYKWLLLAMLSLAFFFHQADRALFGLLTVPIQAELRLDDVQIGWINTALSWTLALMTMIAGFAGDRLSRKWIITISLIFWSLMTVCMGFIGGFFGALFFRSIATGGGESFYAPSAYALLATHHKDTRSIALSIHQAALYIGLMFSGALVAWILAKLQAAAWVTDLFGGLGYWRPVFILFGALGALLGVVFIFALREKPGGSAGMPRPTEGGGDALVGRTLRVSRDGQAAKESLAAGLKAYFRNPSALLATCGFIAIVFVNNAYLFWAPKFVALKFAGELGEKAVAVAGQGTMLYHHIFAFAAILAGGFATDALVKKDTKFRLKFQILALLFGAPTLVFFGFAPTLDGTWAAVAGYGVFRGFFEVNTHASLFDVIAPRYRSTAVGIMNMLAFFFGGLSGLLIGWLSKTYGTRGFEIGFALMGGVYAFAALCMLASLFFTFDRNRVGE